MKLRRWHEVVIRIPHDGPYTFVEVGVWQGHLSEQILKRRKNVHVIQVDRWEEYGEEQTELESNSRMAHYSKEEFEEAYQENMRRIEPYMDRVTVLRMSSQEAAARFSNYSIDNVFIDAGHSYEDAKNDLNLWIPKVKLGGIISGHDYPRRSGVKKAVDEIFPEGVTRGWDATFFVRKVK